MSASTRILRHKLSGFWLKHIISFLIYNFTNVLQFTWQTALVLTLSSTAMRSNGSKRLPAYVKEVAAKAASYVRSPSLWNDLFISGSNTHHKLSKRLHSPSSQVSTGVEFLLGKRRDAVGNFKSQFTADEHHLPGRKAKSCWFDQVCFIPAFCCVLKREYTNSGQPIFGKDLLKWKKKINFLKLQKKNNLLIASLISVISPSLHCVYHKQGNYYQFHYSLQYPDESTMTAHISSATSCGLLFKQRLSPAPNSSCISSEWQSTLQQLVFNGITWRTICVWCFLANTYLI